MKLIERIEIRHFRSFGEKTIKIIDLKDLNIFSGSNDVGKSNVLKSLNLFFNNEITIGEFFDLKKDLSLLQRRRSERELELKKSIRTKSDPYASQRDLFVKIKIHFHREISYGKTTHLKNFGLKKHGIKMDSVSKPVIFTLHISKRIKENLIKIKQLLY